MVFPAGFTSVDSDAELRSAYEILASEDSARAFQRFSEMSGAGSEEARFVLAFMHMNGKGVVRDSKKAVSLLRTSSDAGFIPAVSELAQCYAYGVGVKTDDEVAFKLFSVAAEAGDPYAMGMLSLMYYNGDGVRRDHRMAEEWSQRCEDATNIDDVEERGLSALEAGNGALARLFLLRSAMMGSPVSAKALHLMYSLGLGVHADADEASDWASTAEDTGWDEVSSEDLGQHFEWFARYLSPEELVSLDTVD